MENRCRLCAECCTDPQNLLDNLDLGLRLSQLFNLKVSIDDPLPTGACHLCCDVINQTWEFSQQIQRSQDILSQILQSEIIHNAEVHEIKTQVDDYSELLPSVAPVETFPQIEAETKIKEETRSRPTRTNPPRRKQASDLNLDDFEHPQNPDESLTPKIVLFGWDSYPWTCFDCSLNTRSADDLRDHYASIHGQAPKYSCADCPKIYTKYSTFLSHSKFHRPKLRYCCDVCFKWFPHCQALDKHRGQHVSNRSHSCTTCGKKFRMQSALVVHSRSHLPAELKNRYLCDQCPKRFGTKPNLVAHKRIHAGVREHTCHQCGKSFVQKGNLDNHLLTHNATRPYACAQCGKSFKTHVRLKKHGTVHSGLKPHKCDVCGREFRERGTLKEHLRIHTGAMPFTCEFCGKSFRFKGVLTTHLRQHTGERPYSCHDCQHHFTNWPNYNKHMKRRHGINTSVTVRKPQTIPPTGMPQRNPPGTVLAPPAPSAVDGFVEAPTAFYLYNLPEELLQHRV